MAELSNNPFIDHSASVTTRFPNISDAPTSPTSYAWMQSPTSPTSSVPFSQLQQSYSGPHQQTYAQQQSYAQQQPYAGQQQTYAQQQAAYSGQQPSYAGQQQYSGQQQSWTGQQPYATQQWGTNPQQQQQQQQQSAQYSPGFQPASSFGQQLVGQVGAYPQQQYAYDQQQQQQQQQQQYGGNANLAQFDPYSPQAQTRGPTSPPPYSAGGGGGAEHPREYIRAHKLELEQWDAPTWKQALNAFGTLRVAWEARKGALEQLVRTSGGIVGGGEGFFGGGYGAQAYQQQERIVRLNAVRGFFVVRAVRLDG
jgi:hypothetical protein